MSLWYRALRCRGNPQVIVDQISRRVQELGLRTHVPRVRHEKWWGKPNQEIHVFVAHSADANGTVDDPEVARLLDELKQYSWHRQSLGEVQRNDITRMSGHDIQVSEFARKLTYRPLAVPDLADPFDDDEADDGESLDLVAETARYDHLLLWMSAWGEGSFATLDAARAALGIAAPARQVLRALRLLGHCEMSPDGTRWSIAPTVLVETERGAGAANYVLCGSRDQRLLDTLHAAFATEEALQPEGNGPCRVRLLGAGRASLAAVQACPADDVALALAAALPGIDDWLLLLDAVPLVATGLEFRRYKGGDWRPLRFEGDAGFYQVTNPSRPQRQQHFYYRADAGWRRGEWYGLRYLAQLRECDASPCMYDSDGHRLAVPVVWRWPELFERALVLTSGFLPERDGDWLVYDSVEPELLETLTPKLRLDVQPWDPADA